MLSCISRLDEELLDEDQVEKFCSSRSETSPIPQYQPIRTSHTIQKLNKSYVYACSLEPLLRWGSAVVNLEECSAKYQQAYKDALKAIKHNNQKKFVNCITEMKKYFADTHSDNEGFLDVIYVEFEMSKYRRKFTHSFMGLLSFAAIDGRKEYVEELIGKGASIAIGNGLYGSPLTQVLTYALHQNSANSIDIELVDLLSGPHLNVFVLSGIYDDTTMAWHSLIELTICTKRNDIASRLVEKGANPIHPSLGNVKGVPQLLAEYYEFGTNQYITWLLQQHFASNEIHHFVEDVVKVDIFNPTCKQMFNEVGRHPAHALLMCGNDELVRQFLGKYGSSLLLVEDKTGRTALQIATESGNLESVSVLLEFYYDESSQARRSILCAGESSQAKRLDLSIMEDNLQAGNYVDYSERRQDIELALLEAARNDDTKTVRYILRKDISILERVQDQAAKEGLTAFFEVLCANRSIHDLFKRRDEDGNTVVHFAACSGNHKLFQVFFPLLPTDSSLKSSTNTSDNSHAAYEMFGALTLKNDDDVTPLHLAIKNSHICILKTLQERVVERDSCPSALQNQEKIAWGDFWRANAPKLFIYGCIHGCVDSLSQLLEIDKLNKETCLHTSILDEGMSAAAENGNNEVLQYLLCESKFNVLKMDSPLLLAARNGQTACVATLLKSGADITAEDKDGNNCLMIAAKREHRNTAMIILSDKRGFESLRCKKDTLTPMRMLVEYLPGAAEWILNRCVYERCTTESSEFEVYEFLEDFSNRSPPAKKRLEETEDLVDCMTVAMEPLNYGSDEPDGGVPYSVPEPDWLKAEVEPLRSTRDVEGGFQHDLSALYNKNKQTRGGTKVEKPDRQEPNFTIKLMIQHNRERLLNHVLVQKLIQNKWHRVGLPFLILSTIVHVVFLFLLTAFVLTLPRPGLLCTKMLKSMSNNSEVGTGDSNEANGTCEDVTNQHQRAFILSSAIIVILFCIYNLAVEVFQMWQRKIKYFYDPTSPFQNYFQLATYTSVVIFVFPLGHECWCYPSWRWQIGALAIFLAWINNFVVLKHVPHIGNVTTMLFNIYVKFISLLYLPVLLILTFAFPFYMLFAATVEGEKEFLFPTPFHSIWQIILQTASGPESEFFSNTLSYRIMTYTLFIVFIVALPILFNNFLIAIVIGEVEDERRKAKLTLIKLKVNYISESEARLPLCCTRKFKLSKPDVSHDDLKRMKQENDEIINRINAAIW